MSKTSTKNYLPRGAALWWKDTKPGLHDLLLVLSVTCKYVLIESCSLCQTVSE